MKNENSLKKYWLVLAIVLIVAAIAIYFISKANKVDSTKVSKEMKDFASLEEPSIEKFVKKGYVDITEPLEHDAGINLRNSLGGPSLYVKTVRVDDSDTYYGTIYWKNRGEYKLAKQEFSTDDEARISIYDANPVVLKEIITKEEDGLNKVYAITMAINPDVTSEEIYLFSFK
ncbi:hypothetical protein [uncultured Fenollaria sp.]|uniref:hypothetical protein n=1 Tax=uncultured Fenollaria sp. TaxID=1686315 RepID=UPI0025E6A094|nr:hypothetical protein [uncultured Fenollaria sp.]